jgi:hypothetical protein
MDYTGIRRICMKRILFIIFSIIAVSSWVKAEDKITVKKWNDNPVIIAIREIYTQVDNLAKSGDLARSEKYVKAEGDAVDRIETYFDNDRIRKITEAVSGETKLLSMECYYDNKGILRYVFVSDSKNYSDRDKNKTSREFSLYFDGSGKLFWLRARADGKDLYLKESVPKEDSFLTSVILKYKDSQAFYDSIEEVCSCSQRK